MVAFGRGNRYTGGMIEDRLKNLEDRIEAAGNLPEESRSELLRLLAALRSELAALPGAQTGEARETTDAREPSASAEAGGEAIEPTVLQAALDDLTDAVKKFETSHADVAPILNRISIILSNMGM